MVSLGALSYPANYGEVGKPFASTSNCDEGGDSPLLLAP